MKGAIKFALILALILTLWAQYSTAEEKSLSREKRQFGFGGYGGFRQGGFRRGYIRGLRRGGFGRGRFGRRRFRGGGFGRGRFGGGKFGSFY